MKTRQLTTMAILMALAALPFRLAESAQAGPAPNCWAGQLGLYNQVHWEGHCFGFSGNNDTYDAWPDIRDNLRSAWNGGTSGMDVCIYDNKFFAGPTARRQAFNTRWSWDVKREAESNKWIQPNQKCF